MGNPRLPILSRMKKRRGLDNVEQPNTGTIQFVLPIISASDKETYPISFYRNQIEECLKH